MEVAIKLLWDFFYTWSFDDLDFFLSGWTHRIWLREFIVLPHQNKAQHLLLSDIPKFHPYMSNPIESRSGSNTDLDYRIILLIGGLGSLDSSRWHVIQITKLYFFKILLLHIQIHILKDLIFLTLYWIKYELDMVYTLHIRYMHDKWSELNIWIFKSNMDTNILIQIWCKYYNMLDYIQSY